MLIEKLNHKYDYERLLSGYRSNHPTNTDTYDTLEVFNNGYTLNDPYVVEVCDSVMKVFDFNFALFRYMPPRTTLSWHIDQDCESDSYHIPILSNPGCFYIIGPWAIDMQQCGQLYKVKNDDFHTFVNAGDTPRLHLNFIRDNKGRYLSREFKG